MKLKLNESEVREAVKQYLRSEYGVNVTLDQIEPMMVRHGEFDESESIMEGYEIEVPKGAKFGN